MAGSLLLAAENGRRMLIIGFSAPGAARERNRFGVAIIEPVTRQE